MARRRRNARLARWSGRAFAGALMVAAVTCLIGLLEPGVAPPHLLALYLLPVLAVAVRWGTGAAVPASVLSVAAYAYFFVPVADWHELVGPGVFLAIAVASGYLADRLHRAALDWARLSAEQSALRRVATLVAQGPVPRTVFEAVTREIGLLCGADLARMERYEADGTVTGVAAWSRAAAGLAVGNRFPMDGPGVAREVRRSGGPVQQRLVSLALQLRAARATVPPDLDGLVAELDGIAAGLTETVTELREMARGLHPAILAQGGVTAAVKGLARRSPIPVDLVARVDGGLPERVEVSAYYVVAEALTNAAKHAGAAGVTVAIEAADDTLLLTVGDGGVGGAGFHDGGGLVGLRDRVEALGGTMSLDSPRGVGTTVRAEFPLHPG